MSTRTIGKERIKLSKQLAREYKGGLSIREVADQNGISYGKTRSLLVESGVKIRPRGGPKATVKKKAA